MLLTNKAQSTAFIVYGFGSILPIFLLFNFWDVSKYVQGKDGVVVGICIALQIFLLGLSLWGILNFKKWGYYLLVLYLALILFNAFGSGEPFLKKFLEIVISQWFLLIYTIICTVAIFGRETGGLFKNSPPDQNELAKQLKERFKGNYFLYLRNASFVGLILIVIMLLFKVSQVYH